MELLHFFIDFILHINEHLDAMVIQYGVMIYVILFLIIFVETGLVAMPFLPGDSLLFAAGAICARTAGNPDAVLQLWPLMGILFVAAVVGDNTNYAIGRFLGHRAIALKVRGHALVKQAHIDKTHAFFERYGTKAIIMARFVPIVRTFTPFVAGVGRMSYRGKFLPFDIAGGALWIGSMTLAGYFLGTIPWVHRNFEAVVLAIIVISVMPMVIGYFKAKSQPV